MCFQIERVTECPAHWIKIEPCKEHPCEIFKNQEQTSREVGVGGAGIGHI